MAISLGAIWQNPDSREMLVDELNSARVFTNKLTDNYEGWQVIFITAGATLILAHFYSFLFGEHIFSLKERISSFIFRIVQKIPGVRTKINREMNKALNEMGKEIFKKRPNDVHRLSLPKKGLSHHEVLTEISQLDGLAEVEWSEGFVSGALYYSSPELTKLSADVFEKYVWSNPLHLEVFPQVCRMEGEVVQWAIDIFNGSNKACGFMSSGGTESIILAMLAYRKIGYDKGIKYPEIVCPVSVHCAFNKAASYFRMKLVKVRLHACVL